MAKKGTKGQRKNERKQLINDRDILFGGKIESRYCFPSRFANKK